MQSSRKEAEAESVESKSTQWVLVRNCLSSQLSCAGKRKELQLLGDISNDIPRDYTSTGLSHHSLVWPSKKCDTGVWPSFSAAISSSEPQVGQLTQVALAHPFSADKSDATLKQFQKWAYLTHHPDPSADHVLVLIKFNIFRALVSNPTKASN